MDGHQNIRVSAGKSLPDPGDSDCKEWDGTMDQTTCMNVFGALTETCDPNTSIAKRGGSTTFACMTWAITGHQSTADIFRMHIHQQMVDTFSSVE